MPFCQYIFAISTHIFQIAFSTKKQERRAVPAFLFDINYAFAKISFASLLRVRSQQLPLM